MHVSGEPPAPFVLQSQKDADKAFRPAVQIASHKTCFYFLLKTHGEGILQSELFCTVHIKVAEPGTFFQK